MKSLAATLGATVGHVILRLLPLDGKLAIYREIIPALLSTLPIADRIAVFREAIGPLRCVSTSDPSRSADLRTILAINGYRLETDLPEETSE